MGDEAPRAFAISKTVRTRHFTNTQATTTEAESTQSSPRPVGRERRAKPPEVVLGATGEHAPVRAAAVQDAAPARGLLGLDQGRVTGRREVDVPAMAPVVSSGNLECRAAPVHRGHLEGRRRGRQANAHRLQAVRVTVEQMREHRHAAVAQP